MYSYIIPEKITIHNRDKWIDLEINVYQKNYWKFTLWEYFLAVKKEIHLSPRAKI